MCESRAAPHAIHAGGGPRRTGPLFSISVVQFKSHSGCAPCTRLLARAPSRPFQIMRHSVHACHEFNPPSPGRRTEFLGAPMKRPPKSLAPSTTVRVATKKRVSTSLCDGNDFPATAVASLRDRVVVPRVTRECQWRRRRRLCCWLY